MVSTIRKLCKAKGTNIAELERACGLSARTIHRWDENKPSVDKVKRVADCLEVTVDEILSDCN